MLSAGRDPHQQDAYTIAAWLKQTDASGQIVRYASPSLSTGERRVADLEGWIFGVE